MARKSQSVAAETLDEIQSTADKLADWIREHLPLVLGATAALLVGAGAISLVASSRGKTEDRASAALFSARADYMSAMGSHFASLEIPELANPAAASQIRADYAEVLESISDEYTGTTAGFLSRLERGRLLHESGDAEGALAIYTDLADEGAQTDALEGLAVQRAAQLLEDLERFEEAAARHEAAAELDDYPLRHWALADAAHNWDAAGDVARAARLYQRLADEAPTLRLPDAQRSRSQELRALAAGPQIAS